MSKKELFFIWGRESIPEEPLRVFSAVKEKPKVSLEEKKANMLI